MDVSAAIKNQLLSLGYREGDIALNYEYADVFDSKTALRRVDAVAFTDTPFSYETASIGIAANVSSPESELSNFRSLGAPIWLCYTQNQVEVWSVKAKSSPFKLDVAPISKIEDLFERYRNQWKPLAIHRAKILAQHDSAYQLDFVDLGLLPAIESEVRTKLDRTIRKVLKELLSRKNQPSTDAIRSAYRLCFLLLAAKVLSDRRHPNSTTWSSLPTKNIVNSIAAFYGLDINPRTLYSRMPDGILDSAWDILNYGMSYQHVSADDLAFIYENTLVSTRTRELYGTHSTPHVLAEYLVSALELHNYSDLDEIAIFEPFCGSAVLTVAAMRTLRSILPRDWDDLKRHEFLVKRLFLSDIDTFAGEVAQLSLILADYPNKNGWQVKEIDLFEDQHLASFISENSVVLCNPPFQDFDQEERNKYECFSSISVHKPLAILKTVIDANPNALGFVMPHAFLMDHYYKGIRKVLASKYDYIDLVSLPDRVFAYSNIESSLLVAKNLKPTRTHSKTKVTCATVYDFQRSEFLSSGKIYTRRSKTLLPYEIQAGRLWVPDLNEIWDYLKGNTKLGDFTSLHRGLEWIPGHQKRGDSFSNLPKKGFRKGVNKIELQYHLPRPIFLDCRDEYLRGNPIKLPWAKPKILINARRLQRGIWKVAAVVDSSGIIASSSLVACWTNNDCKYNTYALCAILNSPLAAAYISAHRLRQDINPSGYSGLPLPPDEKINRISSLVSDYMKIEDMAINDCDLSSSRLDILLDIDAAVLEAYDLPPRLEKKLLKRFDNSKRPVPFNFPDYFPPSIDFNITLSEYRAGLANKVQGSWIKDVFRPLPKNEIDVLNYLD